MFVDKVVVYLKAGDGGDGAVSFRREKYVPNGGPDGGDGGKGGSIILRATNSMTTLYKYKNTRRFKAKDGEGGKPGNCSGKSSDDLIIDVPVGTVVKELNSEKVVIDMNKDEMTYKMLVGGKGGLGNQHFATSRRQAPRYAEKGEEGKELNAIFELKMIADVGLIGFPNAGKSTLLASSTNANPKIGSYKFTTLVPNLGVVTTKIGKSFLMADIPGLIEDAHKGAGLGHEFLRHIERTKMLIHVVDVAGTEGRNPLVDIEKINNELELYNKELVNKPQVLALNKVDVLMDRGIINDITEEYKGVKVFPISAVTHEGLDELFNYVATEIEGLAESDMEFKREYFENDEKEEKGAGFEVVKVKDHYFEISGRVIDRMLGYTNLDTEQGFAFFQKFLKEKGILKELEEKGIEEGDKVKLGNMEFDYYK